MPTTEELVQPRRNCASHVARVTLAAAACRGGFDMQTEALTPQAIADADGVATFTEHRKVDYNMVLTSAKAIVDTATRSPARMRTWFRRRRRRSCRWASPTARMQCVNSMCASGAGLHKAVAGLTPIWNRTEKDETSVSLVRGSLALCLLLLASQSPAAERLSGNVSATQTTSRSQERSVSLLNSPTGYSFSVKPATVGSQLIRTSLPLPQGLLYEGQALVVSDVEGRKIPAAVQILTHYGAARESSSARRAIVTFPYTFAQLGPVSFTLLRSGAPSPSSPLPVQVVMNDRGGLAIHYVNGPTLTADLIAPLVSDLKNRRVETVESNAYFLWQRFHFNDPQWPRTIEVRADILGGVIVVGHLQRNLPDDDYAPDFGWTIVTQAFPNSVLRFNQQEAPLTDTTQIVPLSDGKATQLLFASPVLAIQHPTARSERSGHLEVFQDSADGLVYRYLRCTSQDKVPMQQASWRRAAFVVAPQTLAAPTASLQSPHVVQVGETNWDSVYDVGASFTPPPDLDSVWQFHHQATLQMMATGNDWGHVMAYYPNIASTGATAGGLNRFDQDLAIFDEAYRSGDRRLLEEALAWANNTYDQSIWWGPSGTGGTRYPDTVAANNGWATRLAKSDSSYQWRSNSAVDFCTKGFSALFIAYEETGDPRFREALDAQVSYATQSVHANAVEARNIGVVEDFIRLYRYTGKPLYLNEALRIFRELVPRLSTGDLFTAANGPLLFSSGNLFSQNGKPLLSEQSLPFIVADSDGVKYPFVKPYILGYALKGLPGLARVAPEEPRLRETIQAVADFLAQSQDAVGGWRYPGAHSPLLAFWDAIEHAWEIVQADTVLGVQSSHLDAIERALRQRILIWQQSGIVLNQLESWEIAEGVVKRPSDWNGLYPHPHSRDRAKDYTEGRIIKPWSGPEGIVYFSEVLAYYLQFRPASRLVSAPAANDPLGTILKRLTVPLSVAGTIANSPTAAITVDIQRVAPQRLRTSDAVRVLPPLNRWRGARGGTQIVLDDHFGPALFLDIEYRRAVNVWAQAILLALGMAIVLSVVFVGSALRLRRSTAWHHGI